MKFEEKLKEMTCEELEKRRSQLASFIFGDFRKIETELLKVEIEKLTKIECEIDDRICKMVELFDNPQDTIIIDWEEDIREQMNQFYR